MEFLYDDLDILDILDHGIPRRLYVRSDHFEEMDNLTFFKRFRLTRPTVLTILEQIEHELEFEEDKNNSVSPMNQLLATLRFYATGSHLSSIADFMGIHSSTISRIIKRTSACLARLSNQYVTMPRGQEVVEVQNRFFQIASFPRVLGCIDGTHIRIQSPGGDDGEIFRNRKGYFSLNVQVVGDSDLKVRDIVARWPGSQHDSTMFQHSRIRARFENDEFPNSVLLGDSGYALRRYLLTPLGHPVNQAEQLYNESHIRTRNTIERLFGVIKRRFPILSYGIRVKLDTALSIIVACAVLHNIAIDQNEEDPPVDPQNINELNYLIEMGNIPDFQDPREDNVHEIPFRDQIVNYFGNMN